MADDYSPFSTLESGLSPCPKSEDMGLSLMTYWVPSSDSHTAEPMPPYKIENVEEESESQPATIKLELRFSMKASAISTQ